MIAKPDGSDTPKIRLWAVCPGVIINEIVNRFNFIAEKPKNQSDKATL